MDELNEGKRKWRRRSREEIAVLLAGLRESGQTQQAYAKQVGVSLSSIGRWVRGNGQSGAPGRAGFAAVQLRADPVESEGAAVKIRWPEGIEVELPLSLGERSLRRCLREVLTCSREDRRRGSTWPPG